jgi:hypothetical protein
MQQANHTVKKRRKRKKKKNNNTFLKNKGDIKENVVACGFDVQKK